MGCFGFLKMMMFIFNGIIFMAGAGILAVGIWVKVDSGSILQLLQSLKGVDGLEQLLNVGYLLIAVGALLLLLGFLGCCGAVKESRCMLLLFFVIILILFIAEVAGAIVILVFRGVVDQLIAKLGTAAVKNIQKEYGKSADITGLWNATMDVLKCCGFYNFTDFTDSPFFENNNLYPSPCCTSGLCDYSNAHNSTVSGCFPKVVKLMDENSILIIGVAFGIAVLELAAMSVSMSMYCKIGSKLG
ncbi:tetraspanin-1-like [Chanos chanos]|uniref:Tetraspanin n=1 Tax=Chanos chanos TaxID=29144 RepID=A0A6J2WQ13_CHACN|nr:tetraspanin-1-like [Chanos chanos]